jgi:hypothetical protein
MFNGVTSNPVAPVSLANWEHDVHRSIRADERGLEDRATSTWRTSDSGRKLLLDLTLVG